MKKVLTVLALLCVVLYVAFDTFAYAKAKRDVMPTFLEPLRVEFSSQCKNAKWHYGSGLDDADLMPKLTDIMQRRDALLKQRGIRSFKVMWAVEDFHSGGESIKPHAHFSGWYLD